ncbi:MAG: hypothetical protein ACRENE_29295 [Polyangiaceae bacterium]
MSQKKRLASAGLAAITILVPAAALFACGGGAKPAESPAASSASASAGSAPVASASAAPAASASAAPADSSSAAGPTPLGAVLITDASTVQKLFDASAAAPAASSKADGLKGGSPVVKGIKDLAAKEAAGMTPDGPLQTATLKEKGHVHAEVTLGQGKCYALVGFSPTVKDLDVHLMLAPGILSAQDTTDDNKPVVGKAPDALCPSASTAITYKVDIFADQGAGDVGVQLYSKAVK